MWRLPLLFSYAFCGGKEERRRKWRKIFGEGIYSFLWKKKEGKIFFAGEKKMTGSPGQTRPLMWINMSSSWEKICKLIFFQIPVGIWWHWVSRCRTTCWYLEELGQYQVGTWWFWIKTGRHWLPYQLLEYQTCKEWGRLSYKLISTPPPPIPPITVATAVPLGWRRSARRNPVGSLGLLGLLSSPRLCIA